MADDIEEFIAQQKSRLARERQELQQQNNEKVYQDLQNGSSADVLEGKKPQYEPASQQNGGGQLVFGQEDVQAKLRRERKLEYDQYLKEKEARSVQKRSVQGGHGKSLPIQDRGSAKARAENQRNQEYRAFMREKELKEKERRDQRRGAYPSPREQPGNSSVAENNRSFDITPVKKEAASQTPHPPPEYDDSRPPLPHGRGGAHPSLDLTMMTCCVVERMKKLDTGNIRYGDLDYYPVRQSLKPSRSDPRLDRYPEEDGRYSRVRDSEDHDRRRVRFTDLEAPGQERTYYNDRPPYPATDRQDPGYRDQLGVTRSRTLPELERSASKANPRAQSASRLKQEEEGFIIGNRETNSAVQRKKELYRQELAQQIQEQKEAKQRERQEDIRLVSQAGPEPSRSGRRSVASSKTHSPIQPPPAGQATHRLSNQAYNGQPQSRASNQYAINSAVPPLNIPVNDISQQPQRPPPVQEQIGNLGLDEAYAKSRPSNLDQPFSIYNPPTLGQQNPGDPYVYYKLRNPLEPDPNYNPRQMLTFQPTSAVMSTGPLTFNDGVSPGQLRQGQVPPPQYNQIPQASVAFPRGDNSSRNYGQNSDLSPRALKDPKSYQAQLIQQMREKELRKRQEKEDKVRYEAKLEADAQNYNPWGKGGAGAPMRNAQGQVFADLKQLHNLNEQALQDPQKPVQLYSNTSQPVPGNPSTTAAPSGIARAIAERGLNPPAEEAVGGSSQVPPPSNQITSPVDSYKEQLRLQVEEKKRREAAEKEKLRLEEEKEERRLAEQQERMKREFEQEQEAKKRKEEEKRKQQADMEAKLEEKRKEAEERKKEAHSIKRVEPTQNEQAYQRQVASPPVPALTKNAKQ
ncbi:putative centrosome and spindle pole-associated protein 1, partial [Apostichopus japonicus]